MKTASIFNLIIGILMFTSGFLHICKNHWNNAFVDFIFGSTNIIISYICYFAYSIKKDINRHENKTTKEAEERSKNIC